MRLNEAADDTRSRTEIIVGVLGTNTAFDGVTTLLDVVLSERERLTIGNENLLLHEVDAHNLLSDRMLNLKAGVHLKEVEVLVLIDEELDGTCTHIAHSLGSCHSGSTHLGTELRIEEWRWRLLHYLLVTALHRALAVAEMHHIAMLVAKDLELDMVRTFDKLLDIDGVVAKARHSLRLAGVVCLGNIFGTVNETHTLATATHRSLDHHREADSLAHAHSLFSRIELILGARNDRNTGSDHVAASLDLVAHIDHGLRIRAYEGYALSLTATSELSVLAQEAIARVDGIDLMFLGHFDNLIDTKITFVGRSGTNALCLVGIEHMIARSICFGYPSHSRRA